MELKRIPTQQLTGHRDVFCRGQSYKGQMGDGFWNQSWEDYNENNINLTSDYIGPQIIKDWVEFIYLIGISILIP